MTALRKYLSLLAAACLLTVTVLAASAAAPQEIAVREMESLPTGWNPLEAGTEEAAFLAELTGGGMYRVSSDGKTISSDLAELPEDVTAEYAGSYGVSKNAVRGYAYRITLNENACWDDGASITAADWIYSGMKLLGSSENQTLRILANAEGFRNGETHDPAVISLAEAGYGSVTEAQDAGITEFFVDVEHYWGLGEGWMSIHDRSRIRDHAMPQGYAESYLSPALLYRRYLAPEQPYAYFQSEFVGIAGEGTALTLEDVGLLKTGDYELVLVLEEPETSSSLAAKLEGFVLVRAGSDYRSPESSASYGPYRVAEATGESILLERNPNWWGGDGSYEQILCR